MNGKQCQHKVLYHPRHNVPPPLTVNYLSSRGCKSCPLAWPWWKNNRLTLMQALPTAHTYLPFAFLPLCWASDRGEALGNLQFIHWELYTAGTIFPASCDCNECLTSQAPAPSCVRRSNESHIPPNLWYNCPCPHPPECR